MTKTELIHVRIDPSVKEQSECILNRLGVNMSYAVSMFLNQLILRNGFPFAVEIPGEKDRLEELAAIMESSGGNGTVSVPNQRILHLYATGQIDYETAVFAIKRSLNIQEK